VYLPSTSTLTEQNDVRSHNASEAFSERLNRWVHMADAYLLLFMIVLGACYYKFASTAPLPGDTRVGILTVMLLAFLWATTAAWFFRLFVYYITYRRMIPFHFVMLTLNALVVSATFVAWLDVLYNLF
jgi:hypothetical protein